MMIKAKGIIMNECIITVREKPGLHLESYQRDVTDMKRSDEWLNMESRNLVLDSRCVNLFKEFKIARPNAQKCVEWPGTLGNS